MGSLSWEEAVLGAGGKIPALGEEILEEVCSSPRRTQAPAPRAATAGDNGLFNQFVLQGQASSSQITQLASGFVH